MPRAIHEIKYSLDTLHENGRLHNPTPSGNEGLKLRSYYYNKKVIWTWLNIGITKNMRVCSSFSYRRLHLLRLLTRR